MNSAFQFVSQNPKTENESLGFEESMRCTTTVWTPSENKLFEVALAVHDRDTPDRWVKVARMIPGKTVDDVRNQYDVLLKDVNDIEDGLIPFPVYVNCSFTLEFKPCYGVTGKRSSAQRAIEHEKRKGVPWSEAEHMRFLEGLARFGKGDWRNISRIYVVSRTPTQVASHAQKFYIRQSSTGKDKRRSSIHDITTFNSTYCQSALPSLVESHPTDHRSLFMHSQERYPLVDGIVGSQEKQNQGQMMVHGSVNRDFEGCQQMGSDDSTFQMQFQV